MRDRQLSWTLVGLSSFASLHCGTPNTADNAAQPVLSASAMGAGEAPSGPVGVEAVLGSGAGDVGDPLPEVGGQTGDDSGSTALACDMVTRTSLGLDEISPLGFAPNEMLPLALGSHTLPMRWLTPVHGADGSLLDYATRATSDVQVDVELLGSDARWVARHDSKYGIDCRGFVEVDARLTLTSTDGALAEQVDGTLELGLNAGIAHSSVVIPAATLGGSFTFDPPELDGQPPAALSVSVAFARYGQQGHVTQTYGAGVNAKGLASSEWPVWEGCGFWGWVPAANETVRPSTADLIETVRARPPSTLLNSKGERAPLELEITQVPRTGCFAPAPNPTADPATSDSFDILNVTTEVTLSSPALPGPIRVPLDLVGQLLPHAGEFAGAFFSTVVKPCGTSSYYSPQDFVSHCGDWGVDLSLVQSVFLELDSSQLAQDSPYAVFSIRGMKWPGCTPSPDGFTCVEGTTSKTLELVNLGEVRIFTE